MPIGHKDAPDTLPSSAKEIYVSAFNSSYDGTCKNRQDRDACSAKIAWSAVKKKFRKGDDGKWVPKADIKEFSLAITKASFHKGTQEYRWRAVASDTDEDLFEDNMTVELFDSFVDRIERKEAPPETHRSEFWDGGMPYLSVSHYPDLNGDGVPGTVESVYRDGNCLKAKGTFHDTELGRACFNSICDDIYGGEEKSSSEKVRISIAFLDYKHKHKSSGDVFTRDEENEICLECLKGLIEGDVGKKAYLDGHLIHLALTRVPVNPRTSMEVGRSMGDEITTREQDAASIIGEENAQKLEELAEELSGDRSMSIVIKANAEDDEEPPTDEPVVKSEEDGEYPLESYLIAENSENSDTWNLRVRDAEGALDHELMEKAYWQLYEKDEENLRKLEALYKSENLETPDEVAMDEILERLDEMSQALTDGIEQFSEILKENSEGDDEPPEPIDEPHPLDEAVGEVKAAFDAQEKSDVDVQQKLRALQEPYAEFGNEIRTLIAGDEAPDPEPSGTGGGDELVKALSEVMAPTNQKLDMLIQGMGEQGNQPRIPVQRSLSAGQLTRRPGSDEAKDGSLKGIARRSVGLN